MQRFKLIVCMLLCCALMLPFAACGGSDDPSGDEVPVSIIRIRGNGVSEGVASMFAGDTMQLTALISPSNATDQEVEWASSATDVATVNADGLLTAVSEGTSTISAEAGGQTDSFTLTVLDVVDIENMSFAQTEYTITAQKTAAARMSLMSELVFEPQDVTYKNVTWSIAPVGDADPAHVTIDASGEVTVVQKRAVEGTRYTVTATSTRDTSKSATTTVVVAHEKATSVDVRWAHEASVRNDHTYTFPLSYSMYEGLAFAAIPTPSGAMDRFTFTSSNPNVVSIQADMYGDYGVFQIKSIGTAVITVASGDIEQKVTVNVEPDGDTVYPIRNDNNSVDTLNIDKATLDALQTSTRNYWNFDPEGTTYKTDRTASWNDWKNLPAEGFTGVDANLPQMMNTGNGQSIFDAGYGICFDGWDWPCDNEQTNLYVYNKIRIPADRDFLKIRVRTQSDAGLTGRGKFRIRLIDPTTYEWTFLEKDALVGHAWASEIEDREAPDFGTQDTETGWITLESVPDYTKGMDWFWFDISEFKGKEMIVVFETDDIYYELDEDGLPLFDSCDRIQFLCAYFPESATQDPNDLRTAG